MERASGTEIFGCGSSHSSDITLNVQTTTGGNFSINVNAKSTVEYLKKIVSKKLKVSKDRICLLHREKQLRDGTLEENGIQDGSRIILLPSVETGLLSQRPENSVMQALESLNDSQVNDFLSGKSPLNLTMRLGDHMMLIQLQLSTLTPGAAKVSRTPVKKSNSQPSTSTSSESKQNSPSPSATKKTPVKTAKDDKLRSFLRKQDIVTLQNAFELFKSLAEIQENQDEKGSESESDAGKSSLDASTSESSSAANTSAEVSFSEQSPIKSLSNLVEKKSNNESTPSKFEPVPGTSKMCDMPSLIDDCVLSDVACEEVVVSTPMESESDVENTKGTEQTSSFMMETPLDEYPMENLFNSAVDRGLFSDVENGEADLETVQQPASKNKRLHYLLHKTSKYKHPIAQNKQKAFMQSVVNKHIKKKLQQQQGSPQPTSAKNALDRIMCKSPTGNPRNGEPTPSTSKQSPQKSVDAMSVVQDEENLIAPVTDTKALFEASKNLTQTLKKLSKEVLTNKVELTHSGEEALRSKIGPGAVIESMKHHGKGIYSGTFSGTLNPALQDRFGRPKKDISTIIHILNDLLCATPSIAAAKDSSSRNNRSECTCSQTMATACNLPNCDKKTSTDPCATCETSVCQCKYSRLQPSLDDDSPLSTKCNKCGSDNNMVTSDLCKKCHMADALAVENHKTKCKLDQLRLVMQQKKERREARKIKAMPYPPSAPPNLAKQEKKSPLPDEENTTPIPIDTVA